MARLKCIQLPESVGTLSTVRPRFGRQLRALQMTQDIPALLGCTLALYSMLPSLGKSFCLEKRKNSTQPGRLVIPDFGSLHFVSITSISNLRSIANSERSVTQIS